MRTRPVLACALTVVILVGCAAAPTPRTVGEPSGAGKVAAPPPLLDVAGELTEVTVDDLAPIRSGLWPDGGEPDAPAVDQPAVDATVAAAVAWVDAHLTDVQAGGVGHVAAAGLTGEDLAVAGQLTNPDHPVTSVTYHATVGAVGAPEWVHLATVVRREDGEHTATFVFLPDGSDEVVLLAARAGDGTPAPPAASPDADAEADADGATSEDAATEEGA